MKQLLTSIALFTSLLVLSATPTPAAADEQFEWTGVERIVSVGDIHGAYENFVRILKNAGLVDDDLDWIGGTTHLVQNGDIVDRGPHSRKTMELLMDLADEAEDDGGRVHVLIGNHEAMNVVGILDLVSDEEFEAFVDRDSERRREKVFDRFYEQQRREAREKGEDAPRKSEAWEQFKKDYPLGFVEHRRAFSPDGRYGKWILDNKVSIKINDVVFSHGDWSAEMSALGMEEVNRRVRKELSGELPLEEGVTFAPNSPLQFRGLARTSLTKAQQQEKAEMVETILTNLGAARMVVGHTVTSGVIESRFGGKHISIDTGMLELYRGGHRVALEILPNGLNAIHDGGKVRIPETMNESNFDDYVTDVSKVAPKNLDVQLKVVDGLLSRGQTAEAVSILEPLYEQSDRVPFRYRDIIGRHYADNGQDDKARESFLDYIEGLKAVVEASPDNVNLANLLARFCAEKGLKLDLAEDVIAKAIEKAPENTSLHLTEARVFLAQGEYEEALDSVTKVAGSEVSSYEVLYLSGLAYVGLEDETKARAAFEEAVRSDPSRNEAQKELRKLGDRGAPQ